MTIHHIINDYNLKFGGAQRVAINLHTGALKAGMSSKLYGLSNAPGFLLEGAQSLNYKSPYSIKVIFRLIEYFRKNVQHGDIIHVHLFPAIFFVAILRHLCLINQCSLVLTEHSTFNSRRNKGWGSIVDFVTYSCYSKIISISNGVKEELTRQYPFLDPKIVLIHNGVDLTFKKFLLRKCEHTVRIGSVGRLHPSKNFESALKIFSELQNTKIEYWIAGEGELLDHLQCMATNLGIEDRVRFLGFVPDIHSFLTKVDIFFIPSMWEGFGLSLVEAMNAGLPSVVSDVPGLREVVGKNGEDAYLVPFDNSDLMTDRLKSLIESKKLRLRMGEKAFARSYSFDLNRMIESHINLYEGLNDKKEL